MIRFSEKEYAEGARLTIEPRRAAEEDARNGYEPGRPSPKAILNGSLGYSSLGTSEL